MRRNTFTYWGDDKNQFAPYTHNSSKKRFCPSTKSVILTLKNLTHIQVRFFNHQPSVQLAFRVPIVFEISNNPGYYYATNGGKSTSNKGIRKFNKPLLIPFKRVRKNRMEQRHQQNFNKVLVHPTPRSTEAGFQFGPK
ncbi:hypothetical protein [Dyadobacter sp. CY323]|uniref:hypothetical protein n=1 Tax=Dyadobacter sp. CY323 TaxID=2907302 RepID=UPI001F3C4979|nr:hypothetical protein [Dyadobacter sp. CY323]MCE6993192.1 hypothetical protein [Dyadobacter sp. CY323]